MDYLINSAVIAAPGLYRYELLTEAQAGRWLEERIRDGHLDLESRIGYDATAAEVERLCGVRPALSREQSRLEPGDEALVVRLPYRVADPATKGTHVPAGWEYGLLRREG